MTTIAFRSGILAGDSQITDGQLWRGRKISRVKTPAGLILVGWCGEVYAALCFVEWLKNNKNRKPDIGNEDFEAIVVTAGGRVTLWNESLVPFKPNGKFFAIGSGSKAAMGAMHAGKGAIDAVKIAAKIDPYTHGPVHSIRLK